MKDLIISIKSFFADTINMLYFLIAVNAIVYLGGFNMFLTSENINVFAIVGAIFSHASFRHLFFNMIGLYVFGKLLCRHIKSWHFFALYLISGIVGNLIFIVFFKNPMYALVGASGSVFGVLFATAMIEPNQKFVLLFFPFYPLKTKTLAIAYLVIELISQRSGQHSNVAHLAHLGGILGGYVFVEIFLRRCIEWEPLSFIFGKRKPRNMEWKTYTHFKPKAEKTTVNSNPTTSKTDGKITQKEFDYLLDKVSQQGINSLSNEELTRLRQAREQIMGKK